MEKIKVTNGYLEKLSNSEKANELFSKPFTTKTSYWFAMALEEINNKLKLFNAEKEKIIEKYAKRYNDNGETKKKSNVVELDDPEKFYKEYNSLTEIEIELDIPKIKFDPEKEPRCSVQEMSLLLPLISFEEEGI